MMKSWPVQVRRGKDAFKSKEIARSIKRKVTDTKQVVGSQFTKAQINEQMKKYYQI